MFFNMLLFYFAVLFSSVLCYSEEDLGYGLNIGNAIDVFANYGDLSQVTQVISADYEGEEGDDPIGPFSEKNIRVFSNVTSKETMGDADGITNMELLLCETFEELLDAYFKNFHIQGADKPWKAFMGDWIHDEIMKTFGIEYDPKPDCCFVLVKLTKIHKIVELGNLDGVAVKDYVLRAIEDLNVTDTADVRKFMKSYGTHYIESYVTGNIIYQVFKYKRRGFEMLRSYMSVRNARRTGPANLRFYFASYFLKQVGEIRTKMTPNKVLLSVSILLSLVYKSTAIYCFYCNSANNSACIDPAQIDPEMRARIIPIIDCDKAVPRVDEYSFFCRKIVQTIYHPHKDSELRVTRGCGWVRHEKDCYRADNRDHLETVCQCFTDQCNSADSLNSTTASALFVALAICLYFYRE